MKSSRHALAALLVLVLALSCPLVARAQFGGLGDRLKKKATQMVTGKPAAPATTAEEAAQAEAPDTNIVAITAEMLARFETGLRAEDVRRKEVETALRSLKTRQEYSQCEMDYFVSPEGQKLMEDMAAAGQDQAKLDVIVKRRAAALVARCGHDPADYEYKRTLQASIPLAGAEPAKLSQRQYAILRERVQAFLSKDRGMYVFKAAEEEALKAEAATLKGLMKVQP
jgi:hypothetical protein